VNKMSTMPNNSQLHLIALLSFTLVILILAKQTWLLLSVDDYLLIGDRIAVHVERATLIKLRLQFLPLRRSVSLENPLSIPILSAVFVRRFIGRSRWARIFARLAKGGLKPCELCQHCFHHTWDWSFNEKPIRITD